MILRAGRADERQSLEALQHRALVACPDLRPRLMAHPDMIALPRAHLAQGYVRVAEADGQVLGFSVVLPRGAGLFELEGLYIEPACWRRGIGRALVAAAAELTGADLAEAGQLETLELEALARPGVEAFYVKLGFVPKGAAMTAFGPARRMVLERRGIQP